MRVVPITLAFVVADPLRWGVFAASPPHCFFGTFWLTIPGALLKKAHPLAGKTRQIFQRVQRVLRSNKGDFRPAGGGRVRGEA